MDIVPDAGFVSPSGSLQLRSLKDHGTIKDFGIHFTRWNSRFSGMIPFLKFKVFVGKFECKKCLSLSDFVNFAKQNVISDRLLLPWDTGRGYFMIV